MLKIVNGTRIWPESTFEEMRDKQRQCGIALALYQDAGCEVSLSYGTAFEDKEEGGRLCPYVAPEPWRRAGVRIANGAARLFSGHATLENASVFVEPVPAAEGHGAFGLYAIMFPEESVIGILHASHNNASLREFKALREWLTRLTIPQVVDGLALEERFAYARFLDKVIRVHEETPNA